MSVEVIAIGGYEEVGKNISAKPLEKVSSKIAVKNLDFGPQNQVFCSFHPNAFNAFLKSFVTEDDYERRSNSNRRI